MLEKNPETIADVESLNLDGALAPFLLDEDTLKNKEQFLEKMTNDTAKNPLRKLFSRLKEIVQTRYPFDDEATDKFRQRARESADRLLTTFFRRVSEACIYREVSRAKDNCSSSDTCLHRKLGRYSSQYNIRVYRWDLRGI